MAHVIDEHRGYLADRNRIDAFRQAMAATVRPGDVVLDLAAGTGILGLLACQAGAGRVYAVDDGPIIGPAREIAAANGYAERVVHIRSLSTWAELPEPVDLIVSDQIGFFGFDAGAFELIPDAGRRFLKAGGRIVPNELALWVAPAEHSEARAWTEFWAAPVAGLDVSALQPSAASTAYPIAAAAGQLLAPGARLASSTLMEDASEILSGSACFAAVRDGVLDGIVGWFSATLAAGVEMTNAPGVPGRIDRRQLLLPVEPVRVAAGDRIVCDLQVRPRLDLVRWDVSVLDAAGRRRTRATRSTLGALLLSAEDLETSATLSRPTLSPVGEARLEVLRLCDGRHTIEEIESALGSRFAHFLPRAADVARFVAEVVAAHAR